MSETLPPVVYELLQNNNLLHLATSKNDNPSVSLMSFSFVPPTETAPPTIILSSKPSTQKIENIKANPQVSLLIHDWTSHQSKESVQGSGSQTAARATPGIPQSSTNLSQYLEKLNQSQLSQTSVTLYGHARIPAGEEAEFYRQKHLQNNPNAACFIKNADIVLVIPQQAKVADSSNHVHSYDI